MDVRREAQISANAAPQWMSRHPSITNSSDGQRDATMTTQSAPIPALAPIVYRPAAPSDAPHICALYEEEYRPPGAADARGHYPFPQLLDPNWVAWAVTRKSLTWIVAVADGALVGSAGAVRNIGSPAPST